MRQAWKSGIVAHAVQFNTGGMSVAGYGAGALRVAQFSVALLEIMPRGLAPYEARHLCRKHETSYCTIHHPLETHRTRILAAGAQDQPLGPRNADTREPLVNIIIIIINILIMI